MSIDELRARIYSWLDDSYFAAVIEKQTSVIGYVLWRDDEEYVYVRQFYIERTFRRTGQGTKAIQELKRSFWPGRYIRLEMLCHNSAALPFWRSLGFYNYCLTLKCKSYEQR